jgi:hypothetical protein
VAVCSDERAARRPDPEAPMQRLLPQFEGEIRVDRLPEDFVTRLRQRVERGLLVPGNRSRANYRVRSEDSQGIRFGAEGFLTDYAIGLNEVAVSRAGHDALHYEVSFWRWTRNAVAHGALMGGLFLVAYLAWPPVREDVAKYPLGPMIFFGIVGLFTIAWPWVLTSLHRDAAEKALRAILVETMR